MEEETKDQETKFCLNCKRDIPATNFMMHEPHCRRHVALCKVCEEPVPKSQMEEHVEENHAEVPCTQCQKMVAKDMMDDHLADICPHRSVHCDFCDLDVKVSEYNKHAYTCGSRTDVCEVCQRRVMLREMENHGKNRCDRFPQPGLIRPAPQRPPVHNVPLRPPPYDEVVLEDENRMDTSELPDRLLNALDNENLPYVAVDGSNGEDFPEQDADAGTPPEIPVLAYDSRLANPTMVIDQAWLKSMRAVYGEDANLDAIVAQNMMMENMRQVTAHDSRPSLAADPSLQPQRPGVRTQMIRSDAALANALQHEFQQQDIYTAHDTSIAHQFQNELDRDKEDIPPEDTADDEALARRLQEEENRRLQEWSAREYDLHQEQLRSRRQAEMEEASSSNGQNVTDEELAGRLVLEDRPNFAPSHPRNDPHDINLTSRDDLHHGGYGSDNQFGAGNYDNYAPSGLDGAQQRVDTYQGEEGQGAELPTRESRYEPVEQINDIPCDLCSEAIPFDQYNDHLQTVHGMDEFGRRRHHHRHHHHYYHGHFPVRQTYPTSDEFYPREQEHTFGGRQSPRGHYPPAYALEENVTSCKFCGQSVSRDNLGNHEAVCLQNPRPTASFLRPQRSSSPPTPSASGGSAMAGKEDMIPCEFCKELYPLATIRVHQAQCAQHPFHLRSQFGEDHVRLSPNNDLGNHPFPRQVLDSSELAGESGKDIFVVPCEACQKMFRIEELHGHQAVCMLSHRSSRFESNGSAGTRGNVQLQSSINLPIRSPRAASPQATDYPLDTSSLSLNSQQVLNGNPFPLVTTSDNHSPAKPPMLSSARYHQPQASARDGKLLVSRDAGTATPAPTSTSPKAAKSKRKIHLAANFHATNEPNQYPSSGRDPSSAGSTFPPVSPSQVESATIGTQGGERKSLVTGYESGSGSEKGSGRNSSELVVIASQVENCHITSGSSGHPDSPLPDTATSSHGRPRQKTKLLATVPDTHGNKGPIGNLPDTVSNGSSPVKPPKLGAGLHGGHVVNTTKNSPFYVEGNSMYTAASKSSPRQYGALRGSDKPVGSSDSGSRMGSQGRGTVGIAPGRQALGVHNGLSGQAKPMHDRPHPHHHYDSSSARNPAYSGAATRKPPQSCGSHSASGSARNSAQKGDGDRQYYQFRYDTPGNSSKAGSHSSASKLRQNGY